VLAALLNNEPHAHGFRSIASFQVEYEGQAELSFFRIPCRQYSGQTIFGQLGATNVALDYFWL
jgi:hypothetical protein